uniref:DM10 domain-containing protein n=2 Tax=Bursaphelenchus xylophilus TaxID=6326 RepID=A0A1I7RK22_BURXY
MKLSFHLDDETFSLYEPITDNSGHIQGRQFHRQRIPRNPKTVGTDYLDWKDVHVGEDLVLFGRKYRIVGCDDFTKDRGIHVDDSEPIPTDAWSVFRHFRPQKMYRDDELTEMINKASLETELPSWETLPMNLIFHVAWLDSKNDFHGTKVKRTFRMIATPADDTVTLIETTPGFNNQVFLKGLRLSYLAKDQVHRFYRVANFRPGIWIDVFKRPMYIYDCEGEATKAYIRQQFGTISYGTLHMEILERGPPAEQFEILPNELMFKATNDEFPGVKFLILYNVNKRKIDIFEESRLKQWAKGRTFLLDIDATSMSLETLKPGSILRLFKWDFKLGDANEVTAKFIKFTEDTEDTHNVDLYNDD